MLSCVIPLLPFAAKVVMTVTEQCTYFAGLDFKSIMDSIRHHIIVLQVLWCSASRASDALGHEIDHPKSYINAKGPSEPGQKQSKQALPRD